MSDLDVNVLVLFSKINSTQSSKNPGLLHETEDPMLTASQASIPPAAITEEIENVSSNGTGAITQTSSLSSSTAVFKIEENDDDDNIVIDSRLDSLSGTPVGPPTSTQFEQEQDMLTTTPNSASPPAITEQVLIVSCNGAGALTNNDVIYFYFSSIIISFTFLFRLQSNN